MGSHNRITKEKFEKIKKDCKTPFDDPLVAEKHGISTRTARGIRNSEDYQEYTERVFRYHGYPKGQKRSMKKNQPAPTKIISMTVAQLWNFVVRMVVILVLAMLIMLLIMKG